MKYLYITIAMVFSINSFAQEKLMKGFYESTMYVMADTNKIFGTLTIPEAKKPCPIILFIAGSGPTDRDGNQATMKSDAYKQFAEIMARRGFAVLRYDKRGLGESKISMKEGDLRFDHYIDDAQSWARKLKADKRFTKLVICGHSEGSLIGMVAAQKAAADAYISIAGPAKPIDIILKKQLKAAIPDSAYYSKACLYLDTLRQGKLLTDADPALAALFRPGIQAYMINWIKWDPSGEIKKLDIPVLVIQGNHDIQVSEENAQQLKEANPKAQLNIVEGMNHVLKYTELDREANLASYSNPDLPIAADLLNEIEKFIGH